MTYIPLFHNHIVTALSSTSSSFAVHSLIRLHFAEVSSDRTGWFAILAILRYVRFHLRLLVPYLHAGNIHQVALSYDWSVPGALSWPSLDSFKPAYMSCE